MSIVVENKPGASTNIAAQDVARAAPDGRTVLQADNALMAFNEHLFKKLPVDPDKDFSYIGGIGKFPLALVLHPDFPARNFKEFLAYVRANPGKVNYASPGNGSPHHLAMEMFKHRTQTFLVHIPYRGAAPAMQDVMAGQVPVMFLDLASGLTTIQGGKVRAIAYGGKERSALLPGVPTLIEENVREVEVFAFQGLLGPAGMPPATVQRLNAELNKALANTTVLKRFLDFGMEPMPARRSSFAPSRAPRPSAGGRSSATTASAGLRPSAPLSSASRPARGCGRRSGTAAAPCSPATRSSRGRRRRRRSR